MNAKEARERTLDISNDINKKQYVEIEPDIERSIALGKFEVIFYKSLFPR